jgi:membrane protein
MQKREPSSSQAAADAARRREQAQSNQTGNQQASRAISWLARLDDLIWSVPKETPRGLARFFKRWLQIAQRSLTGFYDHDGFTSASSLTYSTLLALVPLLALLMAGLTVFGIQDLTREAIKNLPIIQKLEITRASAPGKIPPSRTEHPGNAASPPATTPSEQLFSSSTTHVIAEARSEQALTSSTGAVQLSTVTTGAQLIDEIFKLVNNANLQKLGPLGFIGLLWAVLMLLSTIESAMNRAWSVHRQRTISRKIADYFHILIVGVLFLLALTTTTSSKVLDTLHNSMPGRVLQELQGHIPGLSAAETFVLGNIAYLIIWPAFVIIYAFLPNTNVRWRSAIAGGLVAGTLYQFVQILFIEFSGLLWGRYGTIYGSFAILFVMFFWIYTSWMIVLWGAEVCATHQNLRDLRRRRREWTGLPYERETLALRLAGLLAAPMIDQDRHRTMDAGDLADALNCPPDPLGEMLELFRGNGLLVQSADDQTFTLARSPEEVTVLDVLRLVRQGHLKPRGDVSEGTLLDVDVLLLEPLRRRTLGDLARMPLEKIQGLKL